jgi:hypothetical protein
MESVFYSRKLNKKEDVRLRGTSAGWEHGDLRMVWGILVTEGVDRKEKRGKGEGSASDLPQRKERGEIKRKERELRLKLCLF